MAPVAPIVRDLGVALWAWLAHSLHEVDAGLVGQLKHLLHEQSLCGQCIDYCSRLDRCQSFEKRACHQPTIGR
jgi:hypothetical protein